MNVWQYTSADVDEIFTNLYWFIGGSNSDEIGTSHTCHRRGLNTSFFPFITPIKHLCSIINQQKFAEGNYARKVNFFCRMKE